MKDYLSNNIPQLLIFAGSFMAIAGAFWSSLEDGKKDDRIINLAQKNSELSTQVNNILTGEGSYPEVAFGFGRGSLYGVPTITLQGDYAIQFVSGSFLDIRALREHQRKNGLGKKFPENKFSFNVLSPASGNFLIDKQFNISEGGRYLVSFFTPYHTFKEELAIEKVAGEDYYTQAYRIYKDRTLIKTFYPDDFPTPLDEIDFLENFSEDELKKIREKSDVDLPFN